MRLIAALVAVLAMAPVGASAGPWTKSLGEFYVKLGQGFFLANAYRDAMGQLVTGTKYLGATTSLYFEVGVFKGLHVVGYLPLVAARNSFDEGFYRGTSLLRTTGGDALLGLQYTPTFFKLPLPAAVRIEFKVPLYDINGVEGAFQAFPAPGDGQLDVTLWLSAGGSLNVIPLFFFGEVGYRFRTEAFVGTAPFAATYGDGIAFFASVGYKFRRLHDAILAVNMGGVIPFASDRYTKGYIALGPAIYVPIWRGFAAEASFDPMVYTNNSAAAGLGFSLGLSLKR